MQAYIQKYESLKERERHFSETVNAEANRKAGFLADMAFKFIKSLGLWDKFQVWLRAEKETLKDVFKHRL